MSGHTWVRTIESTITATGRKSKTQWIWVCTRCDVTTLVDEGKSPEQMKELYGIEPKAFGNTIFSDPPILSCDEEIISAVMLR